MEELRDKKGLTEAEFLASYNIEKYKRPALTADVVIFAGEQEGLPEKVLLIRRGGHPFMGRWAFPGGFVQEGESVETGAARELEEETGVTGVPVRLVGIYSAPGRDPRGWIVTSAYTACVETGKLKVTAGDDAAAAQWFDITQEDGELTLTHGDIKLTTCPGGGLAFDHRDILKDAYAIFK